MSIDPFFAVIVPGATVVSVSPNECATPAGRKGNQKKKLSTQKHCIVVVVYILWCAFHCVCMLRVLARKVRLKATCFTEKMGNGNFAFNFAAKSKRT